MSLYPKASKVDKAVTRKTTSILILFSGHELFFLRVGNYNFTQVSRIRPLSTFRLAVIPMRLIQRLGYTLNSEAAFIFRLSTLGLGAFLL